MRQNTSLKVKAPERFNELDCFLGSLASLSPECRRVLTLRKVYGWEYDRIALHLGIERQRVETDLRLCVQSMSERRPF